MYSEVQPMPGLADRTAIVWGGGASMGRAAVHQLLVSGCRVGIVDILAERADGTAAEFRQAGYDVVGIQGDVAREDDVEAAIATTRSALGPPQLSASVVGMANYRSLLDMTIEEWHLDQDRNILPAFLIGRAMARLLKAEGLPGSLAFIASISGLQGAALHASYGAAKCGLTALVKSMAAEWGQLDIRANCVAPGMVHTLRVEPSPAMMSLLERKLPIRRFARVEEMAACLAFLLSDLAGFVTGETLVADGGWMTVPAIHPSDNPKLDLPTEPGEPAT